VNDALPHDLVLLSGVDALIGGCAAPGWVQEALNAVPVVVVRRDLCDGKVIPVGVRGKSRSERFAAFLPGGAVQRRITPEDLAAGQRWLSIERSEFAAFRRTLEAIAPAWSSLAWGIAGSVGFELATGVASTTPESDLDLIIRAPSPIAKPDAESILQSASGLEVKVDIRIETPIGSVGLKEYLSPQSPRLLMKTCGGPQLVADPWTDLCRSSRLA